MAMSTGAISSTANDEEQRRHCGYDHECREGRQPCHAGDERRQQQHQQRHGEHRREVPATECQQGIHPVAEAGPQMIDRKTFAARQRTAAVHQPAHRDRREQRGGDHAEQRHHVEHHHHHHPHRRDADPEPGGGKEALPALAQPLEAAPGVHPAEFGICKVLHRYRRLRRFERVVA
jgi:hypothetical protein